MAAGLVFVGEVTLRYVYFIPVFKFRRFCADNFSSVIVVRSLSLSFDLGDQIIVVSQQILLLVPESVELSKERSFLLMDDFVEVRQFDFHKFKFNYDIRTD